MNDTARAPVLRAEQLEKRFPGFHLGPLDLTVEPGTVVAVIGPNGSGKTTTLNCVAGLLRPNGGTVEVLGRPAVPDRPEWKAHVGYVGEQSGFYAAWTVAKNLAFLSSLQPGFSDDRARHLCVRLGLDMDARVDRLSRGNRTKLSAVAALSHRPRLLLLDEPTAGLDPLVRSELLDVLWELSEDGEHAILYSTHVLSDIARIADELVFLSDGRILQRTPTVQLTDAWRRISFRREGETPELPGVVRARHIRHEHQVITRDAEATTARLAELGAVAVEQSRLTIDEIAVEILREGHHVATSES